MKRLASFALMLALVLPGFACASEPDVSCDEATGMFTFERERLGTLVAESNRLNARQLVVADEATGNIEVGGRVNLADLGKFLQRLQMVLHLQVAGPDLDSPDTEPVVLSLPEPLRVEKQRLSQAPQPAHQ